MPAGMICGFDPCRKAVTGSHVVEVHQVGEAEVAFGPGIRNRPIEAAEGPLVRLYHSRCWWAQVKRNRLLAARSSDPSGQSARASDLREPETCEVEDLRGGVARDYRGAGPSPD